MFKFFPLRVNFNKGYMKTILALECVSDILGVCVTMDNERGGLVIVWIGSGKNYKFDQCDDGLYYFDTS